jgi:Putative addiction module component
MISLVGDSLSSENRLTAEILSLPSASRAILADKLIESLEFDIDTSIQSAWSSEAKKRRDEVRDGSVRVIPGDDVLEQVRNSIDFRGNNDKSPIDAILGSSRFHHFP